VLEAGVVDHDVGFDLEPVQHGRVAQVGLDGLAAQLLGHALGAGAVQVDGDHGRAGPGQAPGARLPDAAGRPGDQRPAAAQVDVDRPGRRRVEGRHLEPPAIR